MSQAIIDPEEVRRFAAELKRFNSDLRDRTQSIISRFAALGDTWQDQEHEKFSSEFEQMVKALRDQGGTAWYLMARDEGHGFQKKKNADFMFYSVVQFLQQNLLK